ncbi:hypothetical protein [Sphaerotilus mobilis]|uniref:Uncharacterized protein n=1 Tax=Sphaerotilus mobilis TaxID=47994 RepID=A0A4Q7LVJ1_9BURK|nr:hypothetical protein [Sphaerotilus mobilis]RZS58523.1 hypothetical protein EV685_0817 [Sphaerotilus mobilis]
MSAAIATLGRLLMQGLAGPACQQAMLAHTPQPAEVLQAWMLASVASLDDHEGWSRHPAADRPAHAVHLQGAHA